MSSVVLTTKLERTSRLSRASSHGRMPAAFRVTCRCPSAVLNIVHSPLFEPGDWSSR